MSLNHVGGAALIVAGLALSPAGSSFAQEVERHPIPGSDFPIARAVEVPEVMTTVYLSGAVPSPVSEGEEAGADAQSYGDTTAQTVSVLESIDGTLQDLDLSMGDVIKMTVFLVAPDGEGMDFEGFMEGYSQFFGTADQPNLPVRSVVQVAGLANPDWLVEIEVTAVRPPAQ